MTDSQKQSEIASRITRLSNIRSELAVANSNLRQSVKALAEVGRYYVPRVYKPYDRPPPPEKPSDWPSSETVASQEKSVAQLKSDADDVIAELKELGVDEGLFRINGT